MHSTSWSLDSGNLVMPSILKQLSPRRINFFPRISDSSPTVEFKVSVAKDFSIRSFESKFLKRILSFTLWRCLNYVESLGCSLITKNKSLSSIFLIE